MEDGYGSETVLLIVGKENCEELMELVPNFVKDVFLSWLLIILHVDKIVSTFKMVVTDVF